MYPTQDIGINTCVHVISFPFVYIFIAIVVLRVYSAFLQYFSPRENTFNYLIGIRNSALLQYRSNVFICQCKFIYKHLL